MEKAKWTWWVDGWATGDTDRYARLGAKRREVLR